MSGKKLVIVESPAKAQTIARYLGSEYQVEASVGHIRDLPQPSDLPEKMKKGAYGKFAVNIEAGFDPYYVISPDKKKKVTELRKYIKDADALYLATDEDREGEAIAWHLQEVLKPKIPVKRMVFHEITEEAIQNALGQTRDLNMHLVEAQETRRILDRLVGYEVSPLLWRKIKTGLSAGRVQSVATRMVVERERERMGFIPAEYYSIKADFAPSSGEYFTANLISVDGKRIATGKDFDDSGKLKKSAFTLDRQLCESYITALKSADKIWVKEVEAKPYTRRPAAPFTTSTLQQEAGRKLKISSREAMRTAQTLYENGYITYMRTDSTNLSTQAIAAARKQAEALYGPDAIPEKPRLYAKKAKGAQEAHEAIRPAGASFKTPQEVAGQLNRAELALYELIWKRTIACQMNDAKGHTDTVKVGCQIQVAGKTVELEFSAAGTVITNPGFQQAYLESVDSSRYREIDSSQQLPKLAKSDTLTLHSIDEKNIAHKTTPKPRYTEASLVKEMEDKGVGRPSTYASTISVIIDRGYVMRRGQALVPSWIAFSVTRLLEENLSSLVDYDFTALMEADLDEIAAGNKHGKEWLQLFFYGDTKLTNANINDFWKVGLQKSVNNLEDIDPRALNSIQITDDVTLRVGKFGPYLENDKAERASVPDTLAPDEITAEKVKELFETANEHGRELGVDTESGHMIVAKVGRYGPYVTEILPEFDGPKSKAPKPRAASLFKSMDIMSVDLQTALQLLSLPRTVGTDPADGVEITAQNGRFGPYLKKGSDSRSLENEEQLFTITLEEALAIYAQPKTRGRGRSASTGPLKELGEDPNTGKNVVIKDGRFGPYITDGETNVTVPRGNTVEEMTPEHAFTLLADKRAKGPSKRGAKKTAAKKSKTKKTAARKTSK